MDCGADIFHSVGFSSGRGFPFQQFPLEALHYFCVAFVARASYGARCVVNEGIGTTEPTFQHGGDHFGGSMGLGIQWMAVTVAVGSRSIERIGKGAGEMR